MRMYLLAKVDGKIFLIFLIDGEMMRFLLISLRTIYSLKSKRSSLNFVETLVRVVSIFAPKNIGGMVSLLPPLGLPTLAHELKIINNKPKRKMYFFI